VTPCCFRQAASLVRLLEVEAVVLVCVEPVDELDPQAAMISEPATARRIGTGGQA